MNYFRVALAAMFGVLLQSNLMAADIDTSAEFAYVTDFASGKVLMEKSPDSPMKPASMAKIMTVYVAFQRVAEGSLSLDDTFLISEKAWRKGGSKTFVEVGKQVAVRDLLMGVVVQSGNDAAIAIAEGISGTESGFAEEMNYVARQLGMTNTVFKNATGWPDPDQVTTARDLNILATALIRDFPPQDFPDLYPMFAEKTFTYNGIKQGNRNPLVYGTQGRRSEDRPYRRVGLWSRRLGHARGTAGCHGAERNDKHEAALVGVTTPDGPDVPRIPAVPLLRQGAGC